MFEYSALIQYPQPEAHEKELSANTEHFFTVVHLWKARTRSQNPISTGFFGIIWCCVHVSHTLQGSTCSCSFCLSCILNALRCCCRVCFLRHSLMMQTCVDMFSVPPATKGLDSSEWTFRIQTAGREMPETSWQLDGGSSCQRSLLTLDFDAIGTLKLSLQQVSLDLATSLSV